MINCQVTSNFWQHAIWDTKYRTADKRITLEKLADALGLAAPCRTLASFRARLVAKQPLLPQALGLYRAKIGQQDSRCFGISGLNYWLING